MRDPFHPNVPLFSALSFLVMAVLILFAAYFIGVELIFLSVLMFMFSIRAGSSYLEKRKFWKKVKRAELTYVKYSRLKEIAQTNKVLLGIGGSWTAECTRLAYQLKNKEMPSDRLGKPYIQEIVGEQKEIYANEDSLGKHGVAIGTTGSGKSKCIILMAVQQILRKSSVLILDPKYDKSLMESARNAAKDANCPFYYFNPSDEDNSVCIDPLGSITEASKLATLITAPLYEESKEKVFANFAMAAVYGVCAGLLILGEKPTLAQLSSVFSTLERDDFLISVIQKFLKDNLTTFEYNNILDGSSGLKGVKRREYFISCVNERKMSFDGWDQLVDYVKTDKEFVEKTTASLKPLLTILSSGTLKMLLSPGPEIDRKVAYLDEALQHQVVFYVCLDTLSNVLVGQTVGQFILYCLRQLSSEKLQSKDERINNRRIAVFVDEATELTGENLKTLLNKGREPKVTMFLASQTYSDFISDAGSEATANSAFGNINTVFTFRSCDAVTKEEFSKKFGQVTIEVPEEANSVQTSVKGERKHSRSRQMKKVTVPLLDGDLIAMQPDLDAVVSADSGLNKIRIPFIDWEH